MKERKIEIPVKVYTYDELNEGDRQLIDCAKEMTYHSYAPYSRFSVGAAALLANGETVCGSNQENAAYPSGLCAERTALFAAGAQYPGVAVKTLAIAYGGSGSDAGTYPQTATVVIGINTAQTDVHATGIDDSTPLTVTCPSAQDAVYVALLPTTGQRTFSFTVNDGSGNTYTGTAKATLAEGEYVVATGLRLTKQ